MTKKMKQEAVRRMELLKLHPKMIQEFEEEEKVSMSESSGYRFSLNDKQLEMIKEFQEKTGNLVYHLIYNATSIGGLYSLLYVPKDRTEWREERRYLLCGTALAYVVNEDYPECSEYGAIEFRPQDGGLARLFSL